LPAPAFKAHHTDGQTEAGILVLVSSCVWPGGKGIQEHQKRHRRVGSAIFLYHHKSNKAPPALPTWNLYLFSDESLSKQNYRMIGATLVPGHVGFPVLQFFCDNPDFDYYWAIEYDVRFSGDWFFFFNSFKEANHDFLACHIRDHVDEPDWPRWSLDHPCKSIALHERLRCFNPIFRLSNAALSFLHQSLLDGWCGHNEVLFPTLLHHNGFAIADIGGKGRFTPPDVRENFYTESEANSIGLLDSGMIGWRVCDVVECFARNSDECSAIVRSCTLLTVNGNFCFVQPNTICRISYHFGQQEFRR
jgi:Protein of unknown function (DUF3405)